MGGISQKTLGKREIFGPQLLSQQLPEPGAVGVRTRKKKMPALSEFPFEGDICTGVISQTCSS